MYYNIDFSREDIDKFLKEKLNIDSHKYNDLELNDLIVEVNKILDKRIEKEEEEYLNLKKKLEKEEMLLDIVASSD